MESGSNKSLYTLLAVVVFGIFLSLSYFLFQDQLKGVLADVMSKANSSMSSKSVLSDTTYIAEGFHAYAPSGTQVVTNKTVNSISYSSINTGSDGVLIEAKYLDINKNYVFSFDVTKVSGTITRIGGHNTLGDETTIKIDGIEGYDSKYTSSGITCAYPNDLLTHRVEIYFNTKNLVKDGDNVYVINTTQTYPSYYIQPNRSGVAATYSVKFENMKVNEVFY